MKSPYLTLPARRCHANRFRRPSFAARCWKASHVVRQWMLFGFILGCAVLGLVLFVGGLVLGAEGYPRNGVRVFPCRRDSFLRSLFD